MDETVQTAECPDEAADEMTPDDYARLGRAMARVLFAAWRATQAEPREKRRAAG
jgi:hypothetical protein